MAKVLIEFDADKRGSFWGALPTDARTQHLAFPSACPHCGGEAQKTVRLSTTWVPAQRQILWIDVGTCARVWQPAWLRMIGILASVLAVMAGFSFAAAITDAIYVMGPVDLVAILPSGLAFSAFAGVLLWASRGYFALRFTHYNHRSMAFRFPDPAYAKAFAELNRGRVK